ncbi:MAG: TlpA disulfide reductase family protein [Candidatus Marinimicrobia bacterium]|nr:TlpA disulfide reductase family protein [Candidatus Neomarinimicrobiota bacterium]
MIAVSRMPTSSSFGPALKILLVILMTLHLIFAEDVSSGSTIPNIKIRLLDGSSTTLHELTEDGPLMIDFWATWCMPCKKVMRFLDEYHQDYSNDNFKVLMINTDSPRSLGKVRSYIRSQDYKFYVGMDPNKVISAKLNGMVMPTLILVDKGGEVKWRRQGYVPGEEVEIEKQIKQLLEKNIEKDISG